MKVYRTINELVGSECSRGCKKYIKGHACQYQLVAALSDKDFGLGCNYPRMTWCNESHTIVYRKT